MDDQQPPKLVPVNDTKATELAKFVADNRQYLPPETAKRAEFPHLMAKIESASKLTPEEIADREIVYARRALVREQAERQGRIATLIHQAGRRYENCTIESFHAGGDKQKRAVRAAEEYADMLRDAWESSSLILFGPVGTGKDHLAIAVARRLIEAGKRVAWINGQDWFGKIRDAISRETPEAELIRHLASPDVLVLSDPLPPVGSLTQHQSTMLYRLVDARYSRGVPTICTINVKDSAEADERLGAATWDRLCHGAWTIHCNWPSYRKPAREVK